MAGRGRRPRDEIDWQTDLGLDKAVTGVVGFVCKELRPDLVGAFSF
jgi:hypothetical protein